MLDCQCEGCWIFNVLKVLDMTLQELDQELKSIRKETEEKVERARKAFMDSFPFKKGDKIRNVSNGEIFVFSRIQYDNIFSAYGTVYAFKMKNDGTPSKVERWLGVLLSTDDFLKKYKKIDD